ncbi:hypothetical protein SAMD00024442_67_2 [Candidatus Symbiothrix dinenymphae]|nr:hypothetical protein SAMD00024442_67_2 [Candidatus Symbiothrix dinenymphae]
MLQTLPIGIQSFANLRKDDCLYVDKTEEIHRLITSGRVFFLSRPRRFGKSLLVSTMEAIFKGNKALFTGLWIENNWDWTQQYPVIRLDLGEINNDTPEGLRKGLEDAIALIAQQHNITLTSTGADSFSELIRTLHQSTTQRVVVLVDEYDKPITDNLSNRDIAEANHLVLNNFYQRLKPADEHLKFLFLTGASKFSYASVFSGLNHLRDITLFDKFATICGYTQTEVEFYFDAYIEQLAQKEHRAKQETIDEIKRWYGGYSWDGETFVYNPISTLMLFGQQEFTDHWFATGSPTSVVNILKAHADVKSLLEPVRMEAMDFGNIDIQAIHPQTLMFQTGYLTVKKIEENPFDDIVYTLGVPNEEVNMALTTHLVVND